MTQALIVHETDASLRGTRPLLAVAGLFAMNGLLIGGIGGTLPAMRLRLGVSAGGLSVLLVSLAAAAVVSMQIGGRLADSRGGRRVVLPACALLITGVVLLAFAPNLRLAAAAMVLVGLGNGAMDVSMNALGVRVEQARVKPVMSRLHASFSIGNLAGAATVVLIARWVAGAGALVPSALVTVSTVCLISLLMIWRWVPATTPVIRAREASAVTGSDAGPTQQRRPRVPALALLLGAMAFSFGLAEGTAVDWSSVQVTDVAGVAPSTGALGLVAVSSFMVLTRLFGDRAVAAFGRVNVVRLGGLVAACGYLVTVLGRPLPVLLAGWALVGLGVGVMAPQIYAVAGHYGGGRMLAIVVTFGYGAFLVGPAIIGALIAAVGIRHAMAFPLVLTLVLVALSRVLARVEKAPSQS